MPSSSSTLPIITTPRRATGGEPTSTQRSRSQRTPRVTVVPAPAPPVGSPQTVYVKSRISAIWKGEKNSGGGSNTARVSSSMTGDSSDDPEAIGRIMLKSLRDRRGSLYDRVDEFNEKLANADGTRTFKTFNRSSGRVEEHAASKVPNRQQLVRRLYRGFLRNPGKVDEAEQLAGRLPMRQQQELAMQSLRRKHAESLKAMKARGMLPDDISEERAAVSLNIDAHNMVDHLECDTRELSLIRILRAATDTVLFNEAEKLADIELGRFVARVLPDHISRVQLLDMALSSYKHLHVPEPPRQLVAAKRPASGRLQRRASFTHKGGVQALLAYRDPSSQVERPTSQKKLPALNALFTPDGDFSASVTPMDQPLTIG